MPSEDVACDAVVGYENHYPVRCDKPAPSSGLFSWCAEHSGPFSFRTREEYELSTDCLDGDSF